MAGFGTVTFTTALLSQRNKPALVVPTHTAPSRSSSKTDGSMPERLPALSGIISPALAGATPSSNLKICCPVQTQMPPACAAAMRNAAEVKFSKTLKHPLRNTPTLRPLANHNVPSRLPATQQMLSPFGKSSLAVKASTLPL